MKRRLLTIDEAAGYLGRTSCAVREMIWAGKLPSVKIDRRVFLDLNDLDRLIERNKVSHPE